MKPWLTILIVVIFFSTVVGAIAFSKIKSVAAGYLYGYPLLMMDQSRLTFIGAQQQDSQTNRFRHIQQFPDHTFRNVVRPNNDTLYSIAWIDLALEPLIISVPDTQGRYYVMPLMDAWTNVFAMIGKRTIGTMAGNYAIVGPDWADDSSNDLLSNITKIESPTNMVWLIGRIQTNGENDISDVVEIQNEFILTPFSQWGSSAKQAASIGSINNATENPMLLVESLDADAFFSQLATLLGEHAGGKNDSAAINNLAELGVVANTTFEALGPIDRWLFNMAIKITLKRLNQRISNPPELENGWAVHRALIGNYGTDYAFRAGVAKIGLGALPPEEAVYANIKVDSKGRILSASNAYKIHFDKGETPPVNAFWSLSLYDQQGFFTDNLLQRHSIGDRNQLQFNDDGSVDIYIQADTPTTGVSNWLPSAVGNFELTMRLYSPKQSFLSGQWKLPEVELLR
ncbi:MAG: hypothetical protein ACJA2E_000756 [Arenicella sp.]|jgi:hypothetical protein